MERLPTGRMVDGRMGRDEPFVMESGGDYRTAVTLLKHPLELWHYVTVTSHSRGSSYASDRSHRLKAFRRTGVSFRFRDFYESNRDVSSHVL